MLYKIKLKILCLSTFTYERKYTINVINNHLGTSFHNHMPGTKYMGNTYQSDKSNLMSTSFHYHMPSTKYMGIDKKVEREKKIIIDLATIGSDILKTITSTVYEKLKLGKCPTKPRI